MLVIEEVRICRPRDKLSCAVGDSRCLVRVAGVTETTGGAGADRLEEGRTPLKKMFSLLPGGRVWESDDSLRGFEVDVTVPVPGRGEVDGALD